jgi:hypothetical protein
VEAGEERRRGRRTENDLADRRRLIEDIADRRAQPGVVECRRTEQAHLLLRREHELDTRVRAPLGDHPPNRLEHDGDRGLVVGAEDGPAGVPDDAFVEPTSAPAASSSTSSARSRR